MPEQAPAHTGSYYAATVNSISDYAALAGTFENFDVFANINPVIIPGAHRFRNQMVALDLLYYQIKDRL